MRPFAHSLPGRPEVAWEPLSSHLSYVARRAAAFASVFGWERLAEVAGLLHDIGKCSDAFQDYIGGSGTRGPDHSTAGAQEASGVYPAGLGRMLAYVIAGHHAGLADTDSLDTRLKTTQAPYGGWQAHTGPLPPAAALVPKGGKPSPLKGFTQAFMTRMLFSCLVDADFLETERFYAAAEGQPLVRGNHLGLDDLRARLQCHMDGLLGGAAATPINALRAEIYHHVLAGAAQAPGMFSLTVPTGGGKTLASLAFALDHAVRHGLRRVIYVIPFTSIIEQTAQVFREALGTDQDILEHHASFDWERPGRDQDESDMPKLRRASENWDAPVVVTTAVQFFESLFAARTSRCRKLHNIAGSVIVLDEAQTMPLALLRPCVAALQELAANCGATVVLCTATQPALRPDKGFVIDPPRELAPDPRRLYRALKRVTVTFQVERVTDGEIAARFATQPQLLCIVNSRAHARALYDLIAPLEGAVHLTTLMCPRHRQAVLSDVRTRLKAGLPVRLVSTSLIEAGVDISFPEVWRATTGLDSIAQSAGRCNREGERESGRVVVFTPAEAKPPPVLEAFIQAARTSFRRHPEDVLGLDAVETYFSELYWQKAEAMDAARLDGKPYPILPALAEKAAGFRFPFASIARAFRVVEDTMTTVIVPWSAGPQDTDARDLLRRIAAMERPLIRDLRQLQRYGVPIPRGPRDEWLRRGALRAVHPQLGKDLLCFDDDAHYRKETGLDLADTGLRDAGANIIV